MMCKKGRSEREWTLGYGTDLGAAEVAAPPTGGGFAVRQQEGGPPLRRARVSRAGALPTPVCLIIPILALFLWRKLSLMRMRRPPVAPTREIPDFARAILPSAGLLQSPTLFA